MFFRILLLLIITSALAASCNKVDAAKGTKDNHIINPASFNRIELRSGGIIHYTEDTTQNLVVVQTTNEAMEALDIKVEDSTLIIDIKAGYSIKNQQEIDILINSPIVKDYILKGNGTINIDRTTDSVLSRCELILSGQGEINVDQMDADIQFALISGSGDINFQGINAQHTSCVISGSGDMALYGNTQSSYMQINGTGNIYSYPFASDSTTCNVSGSASMRVQASTILDVTISGYANIFYKGFPTITTNITGDGNLVDDN